MEQINREFKAVVQDMTHVYIGAQMSVREIMAFEDVPFKVKAVFNKFFGKEEERDEKICDLTGRINRDDFVYQVIKQLKLKFKVGMYSDKNGKQIYSGRIFGPLFIGRKIFLRRNCFQQTCTPRFFHLTCVFLVVLV